jgi:DNA gyrase subunit A
VINIKTTARNGKVVDILEVHDDDEVMFMTQGGKLIRSPVSNVRVIGRATQGVRLHRADKGDKVVALAGVPKDNGNQEQRAAQAAEGAGDAEAEEAD